MKSKFRPLLIQALNKLTAEFLADSIHQNQKYRLSGEALSLFLKTVQNKMFFVEPPRQNGRKAMMAS